MTRRIIDRLAVPGALAALLASAALASGEARVEAAYAGPASRIDVATASRHAETLFARADMNADGVLDAAEFEALQVALSGLARFNGFVAIEVDGAALTLPVAARRDAGPGERARVAAVAARAFHAAAGADSRVDAAEFVSHRLAGFELADRNRDGVLAGSELVVFAAHEAGLARSNA